MPNTPLTDHVVILVPHAFLASPPSWLTDAFTLSPGGKHRDGATENILVMLQDGSYLEFIAFVPGRTEQRATHKWGHKKEASVIDWAVTVAPPINDAEEFRGENAFHDIQKKVADAKVGIQYRDPVKGGRERPDGVELRWAVSAALRQDGKGTPVEPGQVPFWCLDGSPRHLRVPYDQDPALIAHPSGVVGVARFEVGLADGSEKASVEGLFGAMLDKESDGVWSIKPYSGGKPHSGTTVAVNDKAEKGKIEVSFFTSNPEWVGKTIGGAIDGGFELKFKVVAA